MTGSPILAGLGFELGQWLAFLTFPFIVLGFLYLIIHGLIKGWLFRFIIGMMAPKVIVLNPPRVSPPRQ
jgi:hypothetical protein